MTAAAVAIAAGLGAVARSLVDRAVAGRIGRSWPIGTLAVNVSGSLALGVLAGVGIAHGVGPSVRAVVGTGFIGAYTTFSAFAFETIDLAQQGAGRRAVGYQVVSLVVGIAAAWLGITVGIEVGGP